MPRLNDQFIEAYTDKEGRLKLPPIGYTLAEHEEDGLEVELRQNAYLEPAINTSGILELTLLKGGVTLDHGSTTFGEGGLHQPGLHMALDDRYGDRRYWIADSEQEEVRVSFWDPNAATPHPQDGSIGGQYGIYLPVFDGDTRIVKILAAGMIDVARSAIDAQLASA